MNNGGEVVSFTLATSETWNDRDGNKQEKTEWHNVVIFNENLGKVAKNYLRKGQKAYIEGQLQTRKWTDQNGNDRYTTEVVLQRFRGELVLLSGREGGGRPSCCNQSEKDGALTSSDQTGCGCVVRHARVLKGVKSVPSSNRSTPSWRFSLLTTT
ncbi:MAG: hypothetical protein CFE32_23525 [Alphaproteobacteria bacterium PA3]|nr:MAG: hypothetical protein CFE32_23525 [Alphaproteobacteria bacterium PA3]